MSDEKRASESRARVTCPKCDGPTYPECVRRCKAKIAERMAAPRTSDATRIRDAGVMPESAAAQKVVDEMLRERQNPWRNALASGDTQADGEDWASCAGSGSAEFAPRPNKVPAEMSMAAYLLSPAEGTRLAEEHGRCRIVDDKGQVRLIISSHRATEDLLEDSHSSDARNGEDCGSCPYAPRTGEAPFSAISPLHAADRHDDELRKQGLPKVPDFDDTAAELADAPYEKQIGDIANALRAAFAAGLRSEAAPSGLEDYVAELEAKVEKLRLQRDTAEGRFGPASVAACGCVCVDCLRAGLATHQVCSWACSLKTRAAFENETPNAHAVYVGSTPSGSLDAIGILTRDRDTWKRRAQDLEIVAAEAERMRDESDEKLRSAEAQAQPMLVHAPVKYRTVAETSDAYGTGWNDALDAVYHGVQHGPERGTADAKRYDLCHDYDDATCGPLATEASLKKFRESRREGSADARPCPECGTTAGSELSCPSCTNVRHMQRRERDQSDASVPNAVPLFSGAATTPASEGVGPAVAVGSEPGGRVGPGQSADTGPSVVTPTECPTCGPTGDHIFACAQYRSPEDLAAERRAARTPCEVDVQHDECCPICGVHQIHHPRRATPSSCEARDADLLTRAADWIESSGWGRGGAVLRDELRRRAAALKGRAER